MGGNEKRARDILNPNLIRDINAGYCVQTVFLVASDYPDIINDGFTRPIDPDQYMAEHVVVEKEVSGAEIKYEAWKGLFRNTDTNTANDVTTKSLTTS